MVINSLSSFSRFLPNPVNGFSNRLETKIANILMGSFYN